MKFSKLINLIKSLVEYKTKKFFLDKSRDLESIPRPFYEKSKLSISFEQQFEMLKSFFLLYVQVKVYQYILNLRC